jgi:hypothetical protein
MYSILHLSGVGGWHHPSLFADPFIKRQRLSTRPTADHKRCRLILNIRIEGVEWDNFL